MIEPTKIRPQEILEFGMNKQMRIFAFSPPLHIVEEGKRLLAVTSFEFKNSVFNITDENISFNITVPGHWESKSAENLLTN